MISASTIERCKNEDEECLKKSWNKYIKLTQPNGKWKFDRFTK